MSNEGMVMSTTWTVGTPPNKYRHVSDCPRCGAPICIDAELGEDVLDALPCPYFTCNCRFNNSMPQSIPLFIPADPGPGWPPAGPGWIPNSTGTYPGAQGGTTCL